jgi:hypothetical protein
MTTGSGKPRGASASERCAAAGRATVVYFAGALRDNQPRRRGNKHSAGEITHNEGNPTMGDRSPKSTQKNASQKQAKADVSDKKKQQEIQAQQATKAKAAAAAKKKK